jgi:5-oxoprolinase (ATP-hydrolysing) subunit A
MNGDLTIDLNCDMGELPQLYADGTEEALMQQISSANIACGAHAGSPKSIAALANLAKNFGVAVGAHISYPDRLNFGRKTMPMSAAEIEQSAYSQISLLAEIALRVGARLAHVKPHGALYHDAQGDDSIATAIAKAALRVDARLILVEQALSRVLTVWSQMGVRSVAEAFADRVYESGGKLRSRDVPQALISDPSRAAEQALGIVRDCAVVAHDGSRLHLEAGTICIHGDTEGAVENARAIRAALDAAGIRVKPAA